MFSVPPWSRSRFIHWPRIPLEHGTTNDAARALQAAPGRSRLLLFTAKYRSMCLYFIYNAAGPISYFPPRHPLQAAKRGEDAPGKPYGTAFVRKKERVKKPIQEESEPDSARDARTNKADAADVWYNARVKKYFIQHNEDAEEQILATPTPLSLFLSLSFSPKGPRLCVHTCRQKGRRRPCRMPGSLPCRQRCSWPSARSRAR